ncbi:MAG: hypothetical protein ACI9MR_002842 [Myxococcota bacterium]|jgi:hypothetical protein
MTASGQLADLAATLRDRVDTEQLTPRRAAAILGDSARRLLSQRPRDTALWTAFETLRDVGFHPPAPLVLPAGNSEMVWRQLLRRTDEECQSLVATLVTLPDPATEPERAFAVLALLVRLPQTQLARAEQLLEAIRETPALTRDANALARWSVRVGAARLRLDEDQAPAMWDRAALPGILAGPSLAAWAGHVAAAGLLPTGGHGVIAVLGRERLVNLALAMRRSPELAELLAPVVRRHAKARSANLEAHSNTPLDAVDTADEAGDFALGSERLLAVYDQSGEPADIARAIAARAGLLHDETLAGRVQGIDPATTETLRARAHFVPSPQFPSAPAPPHRGWTLQIATILDRTPTDEDLGLLEAAEANGPAALGWLARDSQTDLLQAARLAAHLDDAARTSLLERLAGLGSTDVAVLAGDAGRRAIEAVRWTLTTDDVERRLIGLRLADATPTEDLPEAAADDVSDPHAFESRVGAALDLLDEGRDDAAATIAVALLKKWSGHTGQPQAATLVRRLLSADVIPDELQRAAERHLLDHDAAGDGLLRILGKDAMAAYPLHDTLQGIALDIARSDRERVGALKAWLGIWTATQTPPAVDVVERFMDEDAALLPLAAAQLHGVADPVTRTRVFRLIAPSDAESLADAVLALCVAG